MDLYNKNIEALKKNNDRFYANLNKYMETSDNEKGLLDGHGFSYNLYPAKIEGYYLVISDGSTKCRMNSSYSPANEADIWAAQFKYANMQKVASIFGFGTGVFVKAVLNRLLKDEHAIVIEPDLKLFDYICRNIDVSEILLDSRLRLVTWDRMGKDYLDAADDYVHWINANSQIAAVNPGYDLCYLVKLKQFNTVFSEHSQSLFTNRNTESYFGKNMISNMIHNFEFIGNSNTLLEIKDIVPDGVPAIIVAAGPSLDKNVEELKRAKGHSVILCTDTAMKTLAAHGIIPDAMVTIDAKKSPKHFINVGYETLPVFCTVTTTNSVLKNNTNRKIWFGCHEYMVNLYKRLGKNISYLGIGGSVANAAFSVCATLGVKKIILIGQDLAYCGDVTHAGGVIKHVQHEEDGITYVEGIGGDKVKTRYDWLTYLKWYEASIEEIRDRTEVIDATEGGALIHGSTIMKLSDAIDRYCKENYDFETSLLKLPVTFAKNDIGVFEEMLENDKKDIEIIITESKRASMLAQRALSEYSKKHKVTSQIKEYSKGITDINGKIGAMPIFTVVDSLIKSNDLDAVQKFVEFSGDAGDDVTDTLTKSIKLLNDTAMSAKELKEMFEGGEV